MANSTSPLPVQPVEELAAEVDAVVVVAQQRLLLVARRLHLQAERRLFPPERPRPQAEDAVVPVVVADVAVPHQRDRNRLRLAC
jgi:hypothetical protein